MGSGKPNYVGQMAVVKLQLIMFEMTKEFNFESERTLTFGCCIRVITFRGVAVVFMWNLIIKKKP